MAKIIIKRTRNEAIDAITGYCCCSALDAESGPVPRFFFAVVAPLLNGCLFSSQSLRCLLVLSLCITSSYPPEAKTDSLYRVIQILLLLVSESIHESSGQLLGWIAAVAAAVPAVAAACICGVGFVSQSQSPSPLLVESKGLDPGFGVELDLFLAQLHVFVCLLAGPVLKNKKVWVWFSSKYPYCSAAKVEVAANLIPIGLSFQTGVATKFVLSSASDPALVCCCWLADVADAVVWFDPESPLDLKCLLLLLSHVYAAAGFFFAPCQPWWFFSFASEF
ncbi:hypothetical protein Acr_11g0014180 [Actinidia rufa]|uniref:Uncharacterized protein n=1 Tax=Actinidia rufa TaxID=165716 RepID=A0A7J0FEI0_9ERIC|nr:hypothetical protein Acr_11g0014180 [Actinidia rufa]